MNSSSQPTYQLLIRPELEKNESLRGYILRLAEKNDSPYILESLTKSFSSGADAIRKISELSGYDYEHLLTRNTNKDRGITKNTGCHFGSAVLHNSQVHKRQRLICPLCISENGISSCLWDLHYYDVCHLHGCHLVGSCSACSSVLEWTNTLSEKCKCGFNFSKLTFKTAPVNRQALCALISKSIEKSLSSSNKDKNSTHNRALSIDWFFVIVAFINKFWIPYFWKVNLRKSMTINPEQCEKLTLNILEDHGYCERLQRVFAMYAEKDPFVLLKVFRQLRTFDSLEKYFLTCIRELTFHPTFRRLVNDKSLFNRADHVQKTSGNQCIDLRRLEIDSADIFSNPRSSNHKKFEYFEILG